MALTKLFQRYTFTDAHLNAVLQDYRRKMNDVIDYFLDTDFGSLALYDTDKSDVLNLKWNEDDSNPRDLNFKVNKANRTINMSGNLTVEGASLINQDLTTDANVNFGGLTIADGGSISLQEDITFTGATTENLIKMPDNLLDALSMQEGSNKYVTFDTVNDEEDIFFYKSVDILHTATHADDHALEIDVDAAMLGDVKALDIDYITGQIDTGQDEGIILINIDETIADGGDVFGLEVLSTDGSANIHGMKVGAVVHPILQDSGTFANPTKGTDNTIGSSVTDTSIGFTQSPDTITDSNNGFGGFVIGELVVVTGATTGANNTTYTITAVAVGAITVTPQPDTVEDDGATITVEGNVPAMLDGSLGTTTAIFEANSEYILIGAAAVFEEIEFIVTTSASGAGIKPTFWYSTAGAHQFTEFTPVDGTDGFKHTGVVAWDASDLAAHGVNTDTNTYDIKVMRTRSNLTTSPALGYAKTAATVEYVWDKDGLLTIANISIRNNGELRFYDNGNYVGFEAPALGADCIWVLPDADGAAGEHMVSDGSKVLSWTTGAGTGDVSAAANLTDHMVVRGNGGAKGVQTSTVIIDDSGNVGIGTGNPGGYHPYGDNLVVYSAGHGGISVISGVSSNGYLMFGDGGSGGSPDPASMGSISYAHATNTLRFGANDAVRMTIGSAGLVTLTGNLTLSSATSTITGGTQLSIEAGSGGIKSQTIYGDTSVLSADIIIIPSGGNQYALYRSTSAQKYKDNITDLEVDSSKLYNLRPRSFNSLGKVDNKDRRFIGLIADEVEPIYPEIVNYNDNNEVEGYDTKMLMTLMLAEEQKLREDVDVLKKELDELKNK